jgi:hypothetical protein
MGLIHVEMRNAHEILVGILNRRKHLTEKGDPVPWSYLK